MRLVPILNATLVSAVLYVLVFEREALLAFAGYASQPQSSTTDAAPPEIFAKGPVGSQSAPAQVVGAVSVQVHQSMARDVASGVLTRGQTEATRRVEARSETAGRVISDPKRRGAVIAAGDVLCELDAGPRAAQLAEAQAKLAEAQLSATASAALQKGGYRSETAALSATAALQGAQAAVAATQKELDRLIITAPFNGVLEEDTAELGAYLAAGGLCARVIALDPIKLVGFLPETEVDKVTLAAQVGAELATGQRILGQVTYLSRSADATTRTFRVEAEVPNAEFTIREGQTVEMMIATAGARAHLLPGSALTLNDAGVLGVRLAVGDAARFMPVTLLRDTPDGVLVTGLPDRADVIVRGQEYVTEGTPLIVTVDTDAPVSSNPAPSNPMPSAPEGATPAEAEALGENAGAAPEMPLRNAPQGTAQ